MQFSFFTEKYPENIKDPDIITAIEYYLDTYREYMGKDHPALKESQWQTVVDKILYLDGAYNSSFDLGIDDIVKMMDKHFITEYDDCDYNILHFVSGDIMKNRFYEECY